MRTGILSALVISLLFVSTSTHARFLDVDDDHMYREAIHHLFDQDIISGYSDRTFKPEVVINRAEFTKILVDALYPHHITASCVSALEKSVNYNQLAFPDIQYQDWYGPYVCTGQLTGLIRGYIDGTFRPQAAISFVEAAKMLAVAFNLTVVDLPNLGELNELWYRPYVQSIDDMRAIPPTIQSFSQPIRRGEVAEMIYRLHQGTGKAIKTNEPYRTYEDIKTHNPRTTYKDEKKGFSLSYPSQWSDPHLLGRGEYDKTAPYTRSNWRIYLGPDEEECTGYGKCISRKYYIDGYPKDTFDDALGQVWVDTSISVLSDIESDGMFTLVYDEWNVRCNSKKALIETPVGTFRLTGTCGMDDERIGHEFDRILETFQYHLINRY